MRNKRLAPVLSLGVALLLAGGCQRLNPSWCETADRCAPSETCDPRTNTCQPRELGLTDSSGDFSGPDSQADGLAGDGRPDSSRDLAYPLDLPDQGAASCSGDLWVCREGVVIQRCTEAGLVEQRLCPDSLCAGGHCQPAPGAAECASSRDCAMNLLCTLFVGPGGTILRRCAPAVPGFVGAGACSSGLDCATGLCTLAGQCYYACSNSTECPTGLSCQAFQLLVEGQLTGTTSCAH